MSIQPGETYLPVASISVCPALGNAADLREASVLDGDVGEDPRVAGAVEHAAVADDDVVRRGLRGVLRAELPERGGSGCAECDAEQRAQDGL